MSPEDIVTERLRRLVEHMGAELGHAHGWKTSVAERMGLHPSTLSKILGGQRRVGLGTAQTAVLSAGYLPEYLLPSVADPDPARFKGRRPNPFATESALLPLVADLNPLQWERLRAWADAHHGFKS